MTYALERYRILETELAICRAKYGVGSEEEEPLLAEISDLWWDLNDAERDELRPEKELWPRDVT